MIRKAFARALALSLLTVALAGCQLLQSVSPAPALPGRIAWPRDGDLWVLDASAGDPRRITQLPRGAAVTGAAWSPDGTRVVYAQFSRRPGENASGADLMIADADGGNTQVFVERDAPSTILDTPIWAESGTVYFTVRRIEAGREQVSIARKRPGGEVEQVVENGHSPGVSADEATLVYLRNTRAGQAMLKQSLAGGGAPCELVPDTVFALLGPPRISPDGTRVVFTGSGEPTFTPGSCALAGSATAPPASASLSSPSALPESALTSPAAASAPLGQTLAEGALHLAEALGLVPRVAFAHGPPWDLYTLGIDGTGLKKLATLGEDEPNATWSPDGQYVAVFGTAALYVVEASGGEARKLIEGGGYGTLDWARKEP